MADTRDHEMLDGRADSAGRVPTRGRLAVWLTTAAWVVGLVLVFPVASELGSVQSDDATDFLPADADSTKVTQISAAALGRDTGEVVVVYERSSGLMPADLEIVEQHRAVLAGSVGAGGPVVPSDDATAVFYQVPQPPGPAELDFEDAAAAFVAEVRAAVADHPDGLAVHVTGSTALQVDVDEVFEGADTTLLLVTVAVVAVLLILTYRSPFLWLVPLLSVGAAAVVATAAVYVVASAVDLLVSTPSATVMIVLVFGAGTDYALLLVSRYREELHRHANHFTAMRVALRRAGPAILASGLTTSLGLLCLMVAQMNDIRGLGMVGSVGIAATVFTMLTLFPAVLVLVGRRAFWPFVPVLGTPATRDGSPWSRVAGLVSRLPGRTLAGSVVVLGSLAVATVTLPSDLPQLDSLTTPAESFVGNDTLTAAYPDQGGRPATIAVTPEQHERAIRVAEGTPGVGAVAVDGQNDDWVLVEAAVAAPPDSAAETDTVLQLRDRLDRSLGSDALLGGPAAEDIDSSIAVSEDTVLVIPLVLAVVLVILAVVLRAVVGPLMVVAGVVLSFGAALGIGALVFDRLFGFAGADANLPVLSFVFLVALGVDYTIFLVVRIRDNAQQTDMTTATRTALASTWPAIVSAGVVLAATFGALMTLPYVPMVELGFVVAVGVLLQTLLIQATFVAPLAVRLGRRLSWPG